MKYEEAQIQERVVRYVRTKWPTLLMTSSPSSAARSPQQGARLKRSGHLAGTPDLMFFKPCKNFSGLLIELKTETGKLSIHQKLFLDIAASEGYRAAVAYGYDQAIQIIEEYLN